MFTYPFAPRVPAGPGGLAASPVPLLYYRAEGGHGVLRGHMARANPQWREVLPGSEALAIFGGPQHYISPTWYPSKQEHGKVVPTWNYVVIHAHGLLTVRNEPEWLLENVRALSETHESTNEAPRARSDAPARLD